MAKFKAVIDEKAEVVEADTHEVDGDWIVFKKKDPARSIDVPVLRVRANSVARVDLVTGE